jgi:hypothetical protein
MSYNFYERYTLKLKFTEFKPVITHFRKQESSYLTELYFTDIFNNIYCWIPTKLSRYLEIGQLYNINVCIISEYNGIYYFERPRFLSENAS